MDYQPLNAAEAARRFFGVLNQVKYQHAAFEVWRGGEAVARIVPVGATGFPAAGLNRLFEDLPSLDEAEVRACEPEIADDRRSLRRYRDAWD